MTTIYWVDLPDPFKDPGDDDYPWVNVGTFDKRRDALACVEAYGIPRKIAGVFITRGTQ